MHHYRSIWISDIHLGTKDSKVDYLLDFIKHTESDYLYLVGDIIDGWKLKKSWFWAQNQNDLIQKVLRKARKGTKIYYIPGNHDEAFRDYAGIHMGEIEIKQNAEHVTADGRKFLVLHGDEFDGIIRYAKWLAILGDKAYTAALFINHYYNALRKKLGYPYWSLSLYLKHKVKNAVNFINAFEEALAEETKQRGFDGIICGHIHKAEIREFDGITYCNDGDWVESCTALVEDFSGNLSIIYWIDEINKRIEEEIQDAKNKKITALQGV